MQPDDTEPSDLEQRIAERDARHAAEIAAGERDPQTLLLLPKELVHRATIVFPENAFGEPQDW